MHQSMNPRPEIDSGGKTHTGGSDSPVIVANPASHIGAAILPKPEVQRVEELLKRCDALGVQSKERHLNVTTGRELPDEGPRDRVKSFELRAEEIKKLVSSVPNLQVEGLPSRPLTGGPLARLWNQTILSKWWRDVFPVSAFDVYQNNEGGSRTKLYRVTLSSKLLSTDIDPSVNHYRSGGKLAKDAADEMRQKLDALAKNDTTADVRQKGGVSQEGSTDRGVSITGASKAKKTDVTVASVLATTEAREERAKKHGISVLASERDLDNIEKLVQEVTKDLKGLSSNLNQYVRNLPDGSLQLFQKEYEFFGTPDFVKDEEGREGPRFVRRLLASTVATGPIVGIGAWIACGQSLPNLDVWGPLTLLSVVSNLFVQAYFTKSTENIAEAYLRGAMASDEVGSLGDALKSSVPEWCKWKLEVRENCGYLKLLFTAVAPREKLAE